MGISFAPISAPQLAPQKRSDLDGLAELLLAVTQARQDIAIKKQGLELERQRTEASVAESGERVTASAAQRAEEKRKREIEDAKIAGADAAAVIYQGMLSAPGGITPQTINAAKLAAMSNPAHKKIAPYVLDELDDFIKDGEGALAQHAQRLTNERAERVGKATETDQVTKIQTDAKNAIVELDLNRVRKSIADAQLAFDPTRASIAASVMGNGATLGAAFRIAGMKNTTGLPDDYVLPSEATGKQTDATRRASGLLSAFRDARRNATSVGPVPLTFVNSLRARSKGDGFVGGTIASASNLISSDKQQTLLNAYSTMAQMWRFHVSGAASALGEASQLMQLVAPLVGDKPTTVLQKTQLQNAIEESMSKVTGAEWSPKEAADHVLSAARANKMDAKVIAALQKERDAAAKFEISPQFKSRANAAVSGDALVTSRFAPSRP